MQVEKLIKNDEYDRETRKLYGRNKYYRSIEKKRAWLEAEHEFALLRGDHFVGRTMKMTGREAKKLNAEYELKFWKALDTNKQARLYRWKWKRPGALDG